MSWLFVSTDGKQSVAVNPSYIPKSSETKIDDKDSKNSVSASSASTVIATALAPVPLTKAIAPAAASMPKTMRSQGPITAEFCFHGTTAATASSTWSAVFPVFTEMTAAAAWTSLALLFDEYHLNWVEILCDLSYVASSSGAKMVVYGYDPNSTASRAFDYIIDMEGMQARLLYANAPVGFKHRFKVGDAQLTASGFAGGKWQDTSVASGVNYGSVVAAADAVCVASGTCHFITKFNVTFRNRKY